MYFCSEIKGITELKKLKNQINEKEAYKFFHQGLINSSGETWFKNIFQVKPSHFIEYSNDRIAFNKPINHFQSISFKLADMAIKIEASLLLVYRAAWLKDNGENFIKEAAMAKLYASEAAMEITREAVQIHGGYGYVKETGVERLMRDAKITQIYEGTSEIQRVDIARELLK